MKNNYDKPIKIRYKLILVGETSVGKTCIITPAMDKPFDSSILETVGVNFKDITIEKMEFITQCKFGIRQEWEN